MDENIQIYDDSDEALADDIAQIVDDIEINDMVDVAEHTIDTIQVLSQTTENIDLDDAFPPLGEPAENLHASLNGRYDPNQHPIGAIEGLRAELDEIQRVKQVRSTGENIAHYYKWADGNTGRETRYGYFVSFVRGTNHIVYDNTDDTIEISDVIGVTVNPEDAGFLGNDINGSINPIVIDEDSDIINVQTYPYGLVCMSGKVKVRALSEVEAGDRVVPGAGGVAEKSDNDYGYEVIAIENNSGPRYAVICLTPQTADLSKLSDDVDQVQDNLEQAQRDINVAINTATEALEHSFSSKLAQIDGQITTIQYDVDTAKDTATTASTIATGAQTAATLASETATAAKTAAEGISSQVATNLATMKHDIEDLTNSVAPLTTWTGPGGVTGATYLIDHIQNDLATKTEVSSVDTRVDSAFTAIQTNAKQLQTMALVEQKYSVGPHSPSDGLTYDDDAAPTYALTISEPDNWASDYVNYYTYNGGVYSPVSGTTAPTWEEGTYYQASLNKIDAIPIGMIYVPTVNVTDTTADGNHSFSFLKDNAYEWDGTNWIQHEGCVRISSVYTNGNDTTKYWYVGTTDVTNGTTIYPAGSLCLWSDGMWMVVANIKDYRNFHISSRAYQTANEIGAEIANARGDSASLGLRIDGDEASINGLATHQSDIDNSIAWLQANATEHEAAIQSAAIVDGAILINTLVMNGSPTGNEFYETQPTWDDGWDFADSYASDARYNPCWAKYPDDDTKYYKYICGANNVWTRYTYQHNTTLASIKQTADDNSASISTIVSNIGADGTVNAASIVAAVNADSSEISMSADRIKLNGGTINMATNQFAITAGNGFRLDQNGITWTTASNPTKMVYSQVLIDKPVDNTQYSSFPDSSTTTWHKVITANDKYASETTDGGATWGLVRKIVGEDGAKGDPGDSGTAADLTLEAIYNKVTNNGLNKGLIMVNEDGETPTIAKPGKYLILNADYITTGTLQSTNYDDDPVEIEEHTQVDEITDSNISTYFDNVDIRGYCGYGYDSFKTYKNCWYAYAPIGDTANVLYFVAKSTTTFTIHYNYAMDGLDYNTYMAITVFADGKGTSIVSKGKTGSGSGTISVTLQTGHACRLLWNAAANARDNTWCDFNITNVDITTIRTDSTFSSQGTRFTLNDGAIKSTNLAFDGQGNLSIRGNITANSILIRDSSSRTLLDAGSTTANAVLIGGFTVNSSYLSTNGKSSYSSGSGVYLGSLGIGLGSNFYVTSGGLLTASGATISGTINSTNGQIGGWNINSSTLSYTFDDADIGPDVWGRTIVAGSTYLDAAYGKFATSKTVKYTNKGSGTYIHNSELNESYLKFDSGTTGYLAIGYVYSNATHIGPEICAETGTPLYLVAKNGYLEGTWYDTSSNPITSDRNKKNSITTLDDRYSILFDNLLPIRYKYNDGTSDRFHTGFIAQDVQSALETANVDSQEFAGLVIQNQGTADEAQYLRYEEFICLNTLQIQKLKTRVAELETQVNTLEAQLNNS